MNKTITYFLFCCLTLMVSCLGFTSSAHAQTVPDSVVGPCDPDVYLQLIDVAQANAEIQKMIIEEATDETDDPSIMSLSCFEGDITKMLDQAESIISAASSGFNLNSLKSFYQSNKNQIKNQIAAAAGKFACENIKTFVQNQIDQCFNFKLIEKQSSSRLGNQACIVSANASIAVNRHGYLYTGIQAQGSVSGPGGFEESVLLGGDITSGLESLYNNWGDSSTSYDAETEVCGRLDPNITSTHDQDYYDSLPLGGIPAGVVASGNNYDYSNVGTYSMTDSQGNLRYLPYENNALCYGFSPTLPYVPCGYEDDGVTPAACGSPDDGFDPSCCNLETTDCSRSGIDAVCPCNQGNLTAALEIQTDEDGNRTYIPLSDPVTGGPACNVGVVACCNGDLNDCTLPEYAGFEYCEGTEPEPEEPLDCDVEMDKIIDGLQLTPEQVVDQCPQDFVDQLRYDMNRHCRSFDGVGSGCKKEEYCRRGGGIFPNCYVDGDKSTDYIAQKCQVFVSNQEKIDNIPPELLEQCEFDFSDLGPYVTPTFEETVGEDNDVDPTPTPVEPTPVPTPSASGSGGSVTQEAPADTTIRRSTVSTPSVATPTTTPSAGGSSGGSSSGDTGNVLQNLF